MRGRIRAAGVIVAACAALVLPASAMAVNPVSFSPVGNMSVGRDFPGAAALPDGRILIIGGDQRTTSEIFDPKTNTFTAGGVGTMSEARYGPAVATLQDGRILVAGGYNGTDDTTSAQIFNPSTMSFSTVGPMSQGREAAAASLLPDGRVLIIGGYESGSLDTTEIFNPSTNTFSSGPTLPGPRSASAYAPLPGGKTLLASGYSDDYLTSSLIFTPFSTFSPTGSVATGAWGAAGAVLPQGRVLRAGGYDGSPGHYLANAEIFDSKTGSFSSVGVGQLLHGREEAAAAELPDGRVLVAGGYDGANVASAEVLSVPSNSFKAKLKGRKVTFTVSNEGSGEATDTSTQLATTAKKKKKKPKLVKTTTRHGGPGKITVKVKLTKQGSAKLAQKGKLKIKVAYIPDGGLAAVKKLTLRG